MDTVVVITVLNIDAGPDMSYWCHSQNMFLFSVDADSLHVCCLALEN